MQNHQLYRRNSKNVLLCKIIDNQDERIKIIINFHDEFGHKRRKKTFRKMINRYY